MRDKHLAVACLTSFFISLFPFFLQFMTVDPEKTNISGLDCLSGSLTKLNVKSFVVNCLDPSLSKLTK